MPETYPWVGEKHKSHTKGYIHHLAWGGITAWPSGELSCSNQGNMNINTTNKSGKEERDFYFHVNVLAMVQAKCILINLFFYLLHYFNVYKGDLFFVAAPRTSLTGLQCTVTQLVCFLGGPQGCLRLFKPTIVFKHPTRVSYCSRQHDVARITLLA